MQANNDPIIININSNDDSFFHACGSDSSDCDKSSVREIRDDIIRTEKKGFWTLIALVVAIWCLIDSVEWAASSLRGSNLVRDAAVSRVEEIPFPGRTKEDNNNNKLWNKVLASGMIEHRENDDDDDGEDIVSKGLFGPNHHISKNLAGAEIHRPVDDFSKDEPSMAIPLQQQPQPRKPTYQGRTDRNNNNNNNEQSTSGMIEPREIDDDDADKSSDGSSGPHHLARENLASKGLHRSHDDFVKDETGMAIPLRQQPQPRKPVGAETMQ